MIRNRFKLIQVGLHLKHCETRQPRQVTYIQRKIPGFPSRRMRKQINFTASFVDLCHEIVPCASFSKITIFKEKATSALARVFMRVLCPGRIGIWKCLFLWREKTGKPGEKARREQTTNSTHIWHRAGIEPGPHWWEASALCHPCS